MTKNTDYNVIDCMILISIRSMVDDGVKVKHESEVSLVRKKGCVLHFKGCGEKPTWEGMKVRVQILA